MSQICFNYGGIASCVTSNFLYGQKTNNNKFWAKKIFLVPATEENTGENHNYSDLELAGLIDQSLDTMDLNKDGFIEFAEYRSTQNL